MQYVAIACRCLLGFVFLWSLVGKARSRRAYQQFVASTRELTGTTQGAAGVLAPAAAAAELLIVVLLTVPGLPIAGYAVALTLLAAYTGTLALALRRGVRPPCRCLGSRADPIRPALLARNAGLLLTGAIGLIAAADNSPGVKPIPVAVSVLAAAVLAALVVFFEDLATALSIGAAPGREM
jgi:hypothetical protein